MRKEKELVMKLSEFDTDKALDFLEQAFNSGVTDRWWTFHAYLRGRKLADGKHGEIVRNAICDVEDDEFIYTFADHKDKLRQLMNNFMYTFDQQKAKMEMTSFGFTFIPMSYWQSKHRIDIVITISDKTDTE